MTKYHLGCGKKYLNGYVNFDHPSRQGEIKADAWGELIDFKIPENSAEEIRSHHVFEHFGYLDSLYLLSHWTLALKEGGTLIVEVPAIDRIVKACIEGNHFAMARLIYGDQSQTCSFHKNGWTKKSLSMVLMLFGYRIRNMEERNQNNKYFTAWSLIAECEKAENKSKDRLYQISVGLLEQYWADFDVKLREMMFEQLKVKMYG